MSTAVLVQNLRKSYGDVTAVKDVSFQVESGEIFGLLGPNGAGKTTTIRCLCTLTKPDGGKIEVSGISAIEEPRKVRQRLGYVAQEVALDKVLTGRELLNLQAALYHIPRAVAQERIDLLLNILKLEDYANQKTGIYSGGIKRRLDLAAGLLHKPDVLILDEPTVGLDIESRVVVWDFLRQLRASGTTILITSHYLEEIDALADRVGIIDQGLVIAEGTPSELKNNLGGDRITLKTNEFTPPQEAANVKSILADLPFVKEVIINQNQGNSLNLVVKSHSNALTLVQQSLEQSNIPIFSITQSRPSLDDVYLAATGKTLVDAELAAANEINKGKKKK